MKKLWLILLVFYLPWRLAAQEREINGVVTSSVDNQAVAGATVTIKGTSNATSTDEQGAFTLRTTSSAAVMLLVQVIGFAEKEISARPGGPVQIVLDSDVNTLDEVVAIGYGTARRKDVTGAVSSIGADKIAEVPVASAMEALQGRLPGVNITATEGSPDAELTIRVRGGGSITQDNSPLYIVDGFPVPSITDIAPSDIESIDILKDASSAAIYGSRGANGVVIVTTKSGKAGRFSVNYNFFGGPKQIANTLDVLSPYDYALWQYEASLLAQAPERYTDFFGNFQDMDLYREIQGNDWLSQTFGRTGHLLNNNLSINGGSEKTKYSVNYTNVADRAIMEASDFNRNNLTFRLNSKPYKPLTFDLAMRYSGTEINGGGTNEQSATSSADSRLKFAMIYPPIPVSGLTDEAETDQDFNLFSPIDALYDNNRAQNRTNYNLNASVSWEIVKGLRLKAEGGMDYHWQGDDRFYGLTTYYIRNVPSGDNQNKPAINMQTLNRLSYRSTNTLNYDFNHYIGGNHNLTALLGQEYIFTKERRLTNTVHGFPESFDFYQARDLSAQGTPFLVQNFAEPNDVLLSYFGRVNYDYDGRYIANVTFRADGSSRFGTGNKWGYFPSAALAWRVSDESFMEATKSWLDDLKIRASYGAAGNNNIPRGQLWTVFNVSATSWINGFDSFWSAPKTMANPALRWETTVSRNIGLDFSVLRGALTGAVDVYRNSTQDLLIEFPVSGTGYDTQFRNMGETRNQGVELSVNWRALNKEHFGLEIAGNMAFNRPKIISLGDMMEDFGFASGWASTDIPPDYWIAVGGQVGEMMGYRSAGRYEVSDFERYDEQANRWVLREGIDDASSIIGIVRPGSMKLRDLNGDGVVTIDDREIIGNANPKHTGGFNVNARIYSFDVGAIFTYSYGNDVYNANKIEYTSAGRFHSRNLISMMESGQRWTNLLPDGTLSNDPEQLEVMNANTTLWSPYSSRFVFSDWAVEKGSFVRLNTLTLGYTVPKHWVERVRIQNLRVYASAYNLALWTNYTGFDPEVSTRRSSSLTPNVDYSAYPRSRMLVFGLNLSL